MRVSLLPVAIVLLSTCAVGCGDETGAVEDEATAKTTTIAKSLQHPGNLVVIDDHLVYSTANFVASGDPELDQQFAYWEGELWSKPLSSGSKKRIGDPNGAVTATARVGDDLLVVDSGYAGVSRYDVATGEASDFYNDYSHFPDGGEDWVAVGGVAVSGGKVYLTRSGSEVMRMNTDGSKVETFAKTFKSGWVESALHIVALESHVFWSADKQGESGSTYNLYRAAVGGAHTPSKVASYPGEISALATDGTRVFVAVDARGDEPAHIDVAKTSGSPRTLVADASNPSNLLVDELGLFFTGADGVYLVRSADLESDEAVEARKVLSVKAPTSVALTDEHLYVASSPGEINEKKGTILRMARAKIDPQ